MAREEDLKKIELKVSVDCCDGCKKKVLKALSVKGVLRTEIHPTLPKVTVIGNVDTQTLIKRLAKCGKMAEVLSDEAKKQQIGEKRPDNTDQKAADVAKAGAKDKTAEANCEKKSGAEQEKSTVDHGNTNKNNLPASGTVDNSKSAKDSKLAEGKGSHNAAEDIKQVNHAAVATATTATVAAAVVAAPPQLSCYVNTGMVQEALLPQASQSPRVYYAVEPCMVPMTYYMPNSYPGHLPPPHYCMRDNCYHEVPVYQPPSAQPLPPRLTEYFNDDNTVGCHVM